MCELLITRNQTQLSQGRSYEYGKKIDQIKGRVLDPLIESL